MLKVLKSWNFALLWCAQLVSGMGDVLYTVGVMVTIFERTGSALQTAGVTVATMLPSFLLGPFAGAIVDQYSQRGIMFLMDVIRAVLLGMLLWMVSVSGFTVWGIYAVVAGLSAASTFYLPARQAIIPSLVARPQLVAANSLILSTTQATYALGFIVGGSLILVLDLSTFIFIDLGTFLVAAVLVLLIRPREVAAAVAQPRNPAMWQAIREGGRYLQGHTLARPLIVMEILEHVPHGIWTSALMLVFVTEALSGGSAEWGWQNTAYFSGQLVGATLAAVAARYLARKAGWAVIGNAFLSGVLTLVYAFSPTNIFAVVMAFVFGPPMAVRDVAQDSLLQASVAEGMLGRVFAMRNMFRNVVFMSAGILFAWLADIVFIRWIYAVGGLLYFGTALYAVAQPALRQAQIFEDGTVEQLAEASVAAD